MEIDAIIEKAKLIKEADNPEGIDNLIKSLESYKANKGDIRKKRTYNFLFGICGNGDMWWSNVEARLYGLTTNIVKRLNEYYSKRFDKIVKEKYHLAGYVIDSDDEIYDYVFDVEFYEISHKLEVLLYKHNFDIVSDFDGIEDYHVYVPSEIKRRLIDFGKVTE